MLLRRWVQSGAHYLHHSADCCGAAVLCNTAASLLHAPRQRSLPRLSTSVEALGVGYFISTYLRKSLTHLVILHFPKSFAIWRFIFPNPLQFGGEAAETARKFSTLPGRSEHPR